MVTLFEIQGRTFCNNGMALKGENGKRSEGIFIKEDCLLNVVVIFVRPSLTLVDR